MCAKYHSTKGTELDNHLFSLCVTHDFSTHFSPESIRKMARNHEIKCWLCDKEGLLVFSSGPFSGPLSSMGLPLIGADALHLRIDPFSSLVEVIGEGRPKEENQSAYQMKLLQQVYNQVLAQCELMAKRASLRDSFVDYVEEIGPALKKLDTGLKNIPNGRVEVTHVH